MTNPCLTCRFAEWKRTASGKLHPDGSGRCRWEMPKIALPKAFYYVGSRDRGAPQTSGGRIERRADFDYERKAFEATCPAYEDEL